MIKKKGLLPLLIMLVNLLGLTSLWNATVNAAVHNTVLTSITAVDAQNNPLTKDLGMWENFQMRGTFTLPDFAVQEGDTTVITLPDEIVYTSLNTTFDLKDSSGNIVAHVTVDPDTKKMTITYTAYAENRSGVSGEFYFEARINFRVVKTKQTLKLNFRVGDQTVSSNDISFLGVTPPVGIPITKSSWPTLNNSRSISYYVGINRSGDTVTNATFVDQLQNIAGKIDLSSLRIMKGTWQLDADGVDFELSGETDVTTQFSALWELSADGQTLTIPIGDIASNEGYTIHYNVVLDYQPIGGEVFDNSARIQADKGYDHTALTQATYAEAGGRSQGYNYTIQIKKENENGTPLANARFDIIRQATNQVVETVTTDSTGLAQASGLLYTDYIIRETQAPAGYALSGEDVAVTPTDFDSTGLALKTLVNTPEKTTFTLTKKWQGDKQENRPAVSFQLKRDGLAYGSPKTLAAQSEDVTVLTWDNLPKYQADNQTLSVYTIEEISSLSDYTVSSSDVTATTATVTNTYSPEKVTISGHVEWVDADDQDSLRPSELVITLLANGTKVSTATVSSSDNWQYAFDPVDRYQNGQEIQYSIETTTPSGYTTTIDGFAVTQTRTLALSTTTSSGTQAQPSVAEMVSASISQILPQTGTKRTVILTILGTGLALSVAIYCKRKSLTSKK